MSKSVISYHKKALSLIFNEHFFVNFIKFIFVMLVMNICRATLFLMPVSSVLKIKACESIIDNKKLNLSELLKNFSFNPAQFFKMLIVVLIKVVIIFAGFVLFFIPGLILALVFAPVDYLLTANTKNGLDNTLFEASQITKGEKSKLFWIYAMPLLFILILFLVQLIVMSIAPMAFGLHAFVGIVVFIGLLLALMEMYISSVMFIRELCQEYYEKDITSTDTQTVFTDTPNGDI